MCTKNHTSSVRVPQSLKMTSVTIAVGMSNIRIPKRPHSHLVQSWLSPLRPTYCTKYHVVKSQLHRIYMKKMDMYSVTFSLSKLTKISYFKRPLFFSGYWNWNWLCTTIQQVKCSYGRPMGVDRGVGKKFVYDRAFSTTFLAVVNNHGEREKAIVMTNI